MGNVECSFYANHSRVATATYYFSYIFDENYIKNNETSQ